MKPVIETHDLCKSYNGRTVVDHLNLTVPQGCVYGFLGPNGAGKSTSMKMLLGLVHPTGGSVELLGHTMNETNRIPLLRQTGSLIESPSGYLHLTARENLAIVADLKGVAHKDIDRVLEIVHLTADANRKVGQYSLGMKQRLGIAMALLGSPKLLVLDEPTNGLDPAGIQEMLLQSHTGVIRVFPAVPVAWQDVSFDKLRAMGAFLVSAEKVAGQVRQVRILPEQGGTLRLAIPEGCKVASVTGNKGDKLEKEGVLILETEKDKTVTVQYN